MVSAALTGCTHPAVVRHALPLVPAVHEPGVSLDAGARLSIFDPIVLVGSGAVMWSPVQSAGAYARGSLAVGDSTEENGRRKPSGYARTWEAEVGLAGALLLSPRLSVTGALGLGRRDVSAGTVFEIDDGESCLGFSLNCVAYPFRVEGTASFSTVELGLASVPREGETSFHLGARLVRSRYADVRVIREDEVLDAGQFVTHELDTILGFGIPLTRRAKLMVSAVSSAPLSLPPPETEIDGSATLVARGGVYVRGQFRL